MLLNLIINDAPEQSSRACQKADYQSLLAVILPMRGSIPPPTPKKSFLD
jgi:hypothetical protein